MYNPVSQATLAPNGMLYTAGMIGRSPDTGQMLPTFDEQAHQAMRNLGALLREAGGSYADVLFVQLPAPAPLPGTATNSDRIPTAIK